MINWTVPMVLMKDLVVTMLNATDMVALMVVCKLLMELCVLVPMAKS